MRNYYRVIENLPTALLEVSNENDVICNACPHQVGNQCTDQAKIQRLDEKHRQVLGLQIGDRLSWDQAEDLIKNKVTLEKFAAMCEGCDWQPLGMCAEKIGGIETQDS